MTRRAVGITAAVVAAALVLAALGLVLGQRARAAEIRQAGQVAAADALAATDTSPFLQRLTAVRTAGFESVAAVRDSRRMVVHRIREARQAEAERQARAAERAAEAESSPDSGGSADTSAPPRSSGGLLIGDSVSLGAESCLADLGYHVDSEVGRQFTVGLDMLRVHAADGLPDTVVLHLGTNGPFDSSGFSSAMALTEGVERVVWVTIALPPASRYSFVDSLNAMIRSEARAYDNVRIADFATAASQHPEWLAGDGIHIAGPGCPGFAQVVDDAVTRP